MIVALLPVAACGGHVAPTASQGSRVDALACPGPGEADEDCPWSAVARELRAQETPDDGGAKDRIQQKLAELLPDTYDAIVLSQNAGGGDDLKYFDLWGRSSNYDASQLSQPTPTPTVDEPILDAINDLAGIGDARHGDLGSIHDAITFAGIEHTYGYLFSLLSTPFGFKRARWVRDDVEAGFGLPRGTLGPTPNDGSLFANVTYFAGEIAFRGDGEARERTAVEAGASFVAPELRAFDYGSITPSRVEETLALTNDDGSDRTVVIRTDFVAFTARASAPDGNTNLLVYSIYDSKDGWTRLISAFPVDDTSRAGAIDASRIGDAQTIVTQYNAFVDGVTNAAAPLTGTRHVLRADGSQCDEDCVP